MVSLTPQFDHHKVLAGAVDVGSLKDYLSAFFAAADAPVLS